MRTLAGAELREEPADSVITIDYREPTPSEAWSDRVKELYDQGKLMTTIAAELGITRNLASKALGCWYGRQGMPTPDGRARRSTLEQKHRKDPRFVQLADEAMKLHDAGHTFDEIAARLKCSRPTIAKAISHWHLSQGLAVPDGRTIRQGSGRSRSRRNSRTPAAVTPRHPRRSCSIRGDRRRPPGAEPGDRRRFLFSLQAPEPACTRLV